ncbi:MAG: Asp-tRNA(Asn)/Glu-tRNA(Gln) amidotransferase subunit GatC [Thermoanaerobacteraceae bacterium]|nr:Asp-tRNA(Asn)/Glu-tRNA(Gln) amidotransferase subunit GatC [Thermoanaerobacteraceae bacterium]
MSISKKDVEHVALLARLEFSEEELEEYTKQLNDILGYVDKLNELDTADVEPTSHVLPLNNVLREDASRDYLDNETALKNAPDKKDGMFRVPKIV